MLMKTIYNLNIHLKYTQVLKYQAFNLLIAVGIILTLVGCEPDYADPVALKNEDSLEVIKLPINKMYFDIGDATWESDTGGRVYFANQGIEFDANKWVDSTKTVETLKIFVKNNKKTGLFNLQKSDPNENFGLFQVFPFSSPKATRKYLSKSGIVNIYQQTDTNVAGTFEAIMIDTLGNKMIIKNGKFNLKFIE